MKTRRPKIYIQTLGCAKNQVDSEKLAAQLQANEFRTVSRPADATILLINTCGFIEEAKKESIDQILSAVNLKNETGIEKLIVMGCLSGRYTAELKEEIPEVDFYFGNSYTSIPDIIRTLGGRYRKELVGERVLDKPDHYAYLKIAEGCSHTCSFCAIPLMRGPFESRAEEEILREAQGLRDKGVRELIIIGQDVTAYGHDLYGNRTLADLLRRLSDIGFEWIRIQYAYPSRFPVDILPVIRERSNICNYLDMPIQHIHTDVLKSMRRGISGSRLKDLLHHIRMEVPEIRLRTTVIVGYPTEREHHFEELLRFVESFRFERLGCFAYSREEGTPAFELGDPVSLKEKQRRVEAIMGVQEEVSLRHNRTLVGKRLPVLIDRLESDTGFGRTEWDTPEVDNEVIIPDLDKIAERKKPKPGSFHQLTVTDCDAFTLFATPEPV